MSGQRDADGGADGGATGERVSKLASNAVQSGETIFREASQLVATVREGRDALGQHLGGNSTAAPYVAAGTALSIGFVLGGGLTIGLTRRLVAVGSRLAVSMLIRRVVENAGKLSA